MNLVTEDQFVLAEFYEIITPNKISLFDRIAAERTRHLTVALENIFQEHNASAVMRSCDCFGIQDLHVIEKDNQYQIQRDIALGSGRWVDMHNYSDEVGPTEMCIAQLKEKGYQIVATTPHTNAYTVHDLPIDKPLAFFFGTERKGLSEEMMQAADMHVRIPMYGFTESFNISVSVAILLQTIRQRLELSNKSWKLTEEEQIALKIQWCEKILKGGEALHSEFRSRYQKD
ncbi:MAG: TrmH family RNA methyltransferase [Flavobacteriales bacterium]